MAQFQGERAAGLGFTWRADSTHLRDPMRFSLKQSHGRSIQNNIMTRLLAVFRELIQSNGRSRLPVRELQ